MRALRGCMLASLLLAFGCSSDEPTKREAPPAPVAPAKEGAAATVTLRARPSSGTDLRIDVVAHGIARGLHGAAFRLHWDPATLTFNGAENGSTWSKQAMALAKEGAPGELVVVWTEKGGSPPVVAIDETVLGTLDFERKVGGSSAALEFRVDRSTLRDADGRVLPAEWRAGTFPAP